MDESPPALVSTITLWPASTRTFTPEGTIPTRDSWSFTSLGTPMSMNLPLSELGRSWYWNLPVLVSKSQITNHKSPGSFPGINLGALQPVREINVYGFPL